MAQGVKACATCGSTTRSLHCGTGWDAWRKGKADPHAAGCSCRVFRCATDWRTTKRSQKAATHEKRVEKVYGLPPGEYERLLAVQGGTCAVYGCRANGRTKKLAVDHCHRTGRVRGLLCGPHNQLLGHAGDDPIVFRSLAEYLEQPPAYVVV